jgi:hypothetical protein
MNVPVTRGRQEMTSIHRRIGAGTLVVGDLQRARSFTWTSSVHR